MDAALIQGKTAIVTGGSGGIGSAVLQGLLDAGITVYNIDCASQLDQYHANYPNLYHEITIDLSCRKARQSALETAIRTLQSVDILINLAGIQYRAPAEEFPLDAWDQVINLNLSTTFEFCQMVGKHMIDAGIKGRIINIASLMSYIGGTNTCAYTASKGAVAQLTRSLANEWSQYGIHVNAIAPGYVKTEMNRQLMQNELRRTEIDAHIPCRQWASPEDIAGPIFFLLSNMANYIYGETICVDGGYLCR